VYFDEHDVVRHSLVQRIIKAYDDHAATHSHHKSRFAAIGRPSEKNPRP
jgi:phosphate starvation-inducible protein PhoH